MQFVRVLQGDVGEMSVAPGIRTKTATRIDSGSRQNSGKLCRHTGGERLQFRYSARKHQLGLHLGWTWRESGELVDFPCVRRYARG